MEETFASSSLIRAQYVHRGALVPLTSVRVCQPNSSKVVKSKGLMDLSGNVDSCGSGLWSDCDVILYCTAYTHYILCYWC